MYSFKDNNNQRKAQNYVDSIEEINKTIKYLYEEQKRINTQ